MIFTPFDLSAAITLSLSLSASFSSRPPRLRESRPLAERTKGARRAKNRRKGKEKEENRADDGSCTSPLVITVRRFTAGRLLYSKDPRGRGKDTIPGGGGGGDFPSCNLLDECACVCKAEAVLSAE